MNRNSINKIIVFPVAAVAFILGIFSVCYFFLWSPLGYTVGKMQGSIKNDYITYLRNLIISVMIVSTADYLLGSNDTGSSKENHRK
jgi:hypothetical protein